MSGWEIVLLAAGLTLAPILPLAILSLILCVQIQGERAEGLTTGYFATEEQKERHRHLDKLAREQRWDELREVFDGQREADRS